MVWKLRVWIKRFLARYMLVMEYCKTCGREVECVFHVDDSIWEDVVGDPGTIRCLRCFCSAAEKKGHYFRWSHSPL
jgi:hypothetical protein